MIGWLVVLRIYVALAIFQSYRELKAEDNQFKLRGRESIPRPLAPQAKSLTTRPPPLLLNQEKVIQKLQNEERTHSVVFRLVA